ncbi:lipopolysaccharide assembly protein LapB [Teredinibacter purpureus]|uniref:lipopolysaccharide assembly protein LapB n=1 Tax=Teredinibacter purpureus TaxID=2731756 RepID=UPI0005F887E6|nr:lipopolysaccharide assembly protein LapB [Teredinibacter purpureus]
MVDYLVFALLLVAVAVGYVLGRYQRAGERQNAGAAPGNSYYQGLNHLLKDEPDAAIDTFIAALDVNSETLETHLALGNLLRKRGEAARAIRVHQNVLSQPNLSKAQRHLAQLELGVDYMKSGLLDRAESLFKELAEVKGLDNAFREQALSYLLEVYQDTKEWLAAIDVADRLTAAKFSSTADEWRHRQAQYSCELAEEALAGQAAGEARRFVRNALRYDKACARAALLQSKIELAEGGAAVALTVLRKLPHHNPEFISEALPLIYTCFQALNSPKEMTAFYQEIYTDSHSLLVLSYLAKSIAQEQGEDVVVDFLLQELQAFPQMDAAGELLKLVSENTSQWIGFNYGTIKGVLEKLTHANCEYECAGCGFSGEQLHWLCPSCKRWSTITAR